ncbi:HNH endonuclease [Frankia sp. AgW1.1]|uniref:HNH endonuclease n=1 Tax=Frankia sp. AgW1.1 TaxID=1836971 RepID=UPI00193230FC|nr:HNH endonuclease [Frankia sp. AgW1.1]MBL7487050.1 HNH endonuclease [Frankia sp. AgW1.1]
MLQVRDCGHQTPCWVWTGTIDSHGYGVVTIQGRQHRLHRLVYEAVNGPMPRKNADGKRIVSDHLCRNRPCANPDHIEPVTDAVNVMRGVSFAPANAEKTHCSRGHEYTPENTAADHKGHRVCRKCRRGRGREQDARRRAKRRAEAPPREPKPKPVPKPVRLAPCGTISAYTRHMRHKEPTDAACRKAHADYMRQYKAKKRATGD